MTSFSEKNMFGKTHGGPLVESINTGFFCWLISEIVVQPTGAKQASYSANLSHITV
jgi:hypothetical protein